MTAISITDLNNAKLDVDHIAEMATSLAATATDRLGHVKQTMSAAGNDVALTAAGQATTARIAAEAARDAALIQAGVYTTEALGRAAVADGVAFKVQGSGDVAAYEYRRIDAVTVSALIATYPSSASVDSLHQIIRYDDTNTDLNRWSDAAGFTAARLGGDGTFESQAFTAGPQIFKNDIITTQATAEDGVITRDSYGFWLSVVGVPQDPVVVSSDINLLFRNAENLAAASALRDEINSEVQRPVFDYNIVITYGQSLSSAYEAWPALSKTAKPNLDNLMLGGSVRPASWNAAAFTPLGSATLNPLTAVVQAIGGASVLNDATVAALTPGAANEGESCDVGAVNMWRKMQLQFRGVASDSDRRFVAVNCGVAGKTVEQLSKGASPDLYNRIIEAVTQVKALATTAGKTCGVVAIFHLQGEFNYATTWGGTTDKATFKALTKTLMDNIIADCAVGICGQTAPPAVITYQTTAGYTQDNTNMSIGSAQYEMAEENQNWYVATPSYPFPDKNGHLDPNGYRWMGMHFGKVAHRVVDRGQHWQPLKPRSATVSGTEVLIDFLVWAPPLQFRDSYKVLDVYNPASRGFYCTDDGGEVSISAVEIAASSVVRLTLANEATGQLYVWYAPGTTHTGNGNLYDSDATVASDNYEYSAGTGQYAGANIAGLVDQPYPLNNPCVAFRIAATAL